MFTLRDDTGAVIDVDPRSAEIADAHMLATKLDRSPPHLQQWLGRQGSWVGQRTPAVCREASLAVGDLVILQGQVILPLPGEMKEADTERRVLAKRISLYMSSPWRGPNGRDLIILSLLFAISILGVLGCALWAGWL